MRYLTEVEVGSLPPERFGSVLDAETYDRFLEAVERARSLFEGRVVWNVNSTAHGGGVAEMLRSLLAYARGAGVDARWLVEHGDPEFFKVTKRIHNRLHGAAGDGLPLDDSARAVYDEALTPVAAELQERVAPSDIVLLHDPQTAGLIAAAKQVGCPVIWRCHVGLDLPDEESREAWRFLIPYVSRADGYVFSRAAFAWEGLDEAHMTVIAPSIDAFSPKNHEMDATTVEAILSRTGLIGDGDGGDATFTRIDGSQGRVERPATYYDGGDPPPDDAALVVQVSRWDRLKDPVGVIRGFARSVASHTDAHLIVAGPAVEAVSDDPEGAEVLEESKSEWAGLAENIRGRVHLACLPMTDDEENAAIVNALQRRADVVVQKSLAEGFGLTVAEAMWKGRPVVASRIGGIQDQITHGETGVLIDNPADLDTFGAAVTDLLADQERAERMGAAAKARVRDDFLGARHLMQYVELFARFLT